MDDSIARRSLNPAPAISGTDESQMTDESQTTNQDQLTSQDQPMTSQSHFVPRRCTLDGFAQEVALTDGINIREAEPLIPILVTTQYSLYRIIPLQWGSSRVIVQGGQFFPEPTEATLAGSTFGGSFIKLYWIGAGMHMEINTENGEGPITTSRVASIATERDQTATASRH